MPEDKGQKWPPTLEGHAFILTRLQHHHIEAISLQLKDTENARLFQRVYGHVYSVAQDLHRLVDEEVEGRAERISYAICPKPLARPIGWAVLYNMNSDQGVLDLAFFLSREARLPIGPRVMMPLFYQAYEVFGYAKIEYYRGSQPRASDNPNFELLSVLSRQFLVSEAEDGSHFVITAEQYRGARQVFEAYDEGLGPIGTGG